MKVYLNIAESIQESLESQSVDLKELINDHIGKNPIDEIVPVNDPFGKEGGKSLIGLIMIAGEVILVGAALIKGLKTLYDGVTFIEKRYLLKKEKDKNGYEKIIREALKDDYKVQETDEVYVEIIKKALE